MKKKPVAKPPTLRKIGDAMAKFIATDIVDNDYGSPAPCPCKHCRTGRDLVAQWKRAAS